jgi:excisionase family DNA binding protein
MCPTSCPTTESDGKRESRGHHSPRPEVFALTIREAAKVAKVSRSTLYKKYICSGTLAAKKCGSRTLILSDDLVAFLRNLPSFPAKGTQNEGSD